MTSPDERVLAGQAQSILVHLNLLPKSTYFYFTFVCAQTIVHCHYSPAGHFFLVDRSREYQLRTRMIAVDNAEIMSRMVL